MAASGSVRPETLRVDPGGETTCDVVVRNTGTVVDEFRIGVLGDAAGWAFVEPPTLSLFPGTEGTSRISFRPPRSPEVPAGAVPFGVRIVPEGDPEGSVVEEGTLELGRFTDVFVELTPRTSRGRLGARHDLALDNRGNTRVNGKLAARDPDDVLAFTLDPPSVVADPNTAAFSRIKVRPRRRFLRGPAKTQPFQVVVDSDGAGLASAEGTMVQEALIPRWLPAAALGLIALVILWFALFKPTLVSTAEEAADEALAAQGQRIVELEKKVFGTSADGTDTTPDATAHDLRLATDAKPGSSDTEKSPVGDGKTFSLTDVLLQNPAGDLGTLEVRRGDDVILRTNLANFRDLDYHFVSPIVFKGKDVTLFVECANPPGSPNCTPAAYFAGYLK